MESFHVCACRHRCLTPVSLWKKKKEKKNHHFFSSLIPMGCLLLDMQLYNRAARVGAVCRQLVALPQMRQQLAFGTLAPDVPDLQVRQMRGSTLQLAQLPSPGLTRIIHFVGCFL